MLGKLGSTNARACSTELNLANPKPLLTPRTRSMMTVVESTEAPRFSRNWRRWRSTA